MSRQSAIRVFAMVAGALTAGSVGAGTIVGSDHDFSSTGWAGGEICVACHAPHNNQNAQGELLWNHDPTMASFTVYDSNSMSTTPGQPAGTSKLCLSCHDGTVALDSFGGGPGTTISGTITGGANFGTDLSNDHPISFPYPADPAAEELAATNTIVTFGDGSSGTISDMLDGGSVQCQSCHDVHNTRTAAGTELLLIDNNGSGLCLTCHTK